MTPSSVAIQSVRSSTASLFTVAPAGKTLQRSRDWWTKTLAGADPDPLARVGGDGRGAGLRRLATASEQRDREARAGSRQTAHQTVTFFTLSLARSSFAQARLGGELDVPRVGGGQLLAG